MLKITSIAFEVFKTPYNVDANKYQENKTVKFSRNMRSLVNNSKKNIM